ncbi:MAG: hypothetical protein ACJAVA_000318 [Flavobacteriaceae bacterium]|jgi:hypothetical protein
MKYKILIGNSLEVEKQLNEFDRSWYITVVSMTNELTQVIIKITGTK